MKDIKTFQNMKKEQRAIFDIIYGSSRSLDYFQSGNKLVLQKTLGEYSLYYLTSRPNNCSQYLIIKTSDLDVYQERVPTIEFVLKDYTLDLQYWVSSESKTPKEALDLLELFQQENKTTDTTPNASVYSKLYVVVRDDVPAHMVPVLIAHTVINAHDHFRTKTKFQNDYELWRIHSFRKVVVKVPPNIFEKITKELNCYVGYENKTLNGEHSCAVVHPVMSDNIPKVLQYAALWKP